MIKIWDDVENFYNNHQIVNKECFGMYLKTTDKILATLQIAKLIEFYGGYADNNEEYWCIIPCGLHEDELEIICSSEDDCYGRNFIRFKSFELAKEFMSYQENVKLIHQYYLL